MPSSRPRRTSLQKRILLPFFLVLILVALVIVFGTGYDIARSYTDSVGERLQAFHEVIYREIKEQEKLLVTYANLLEYMQTADSTAAGLLQDQLYNSLHAENIAVASYSAAAREAVPYPSLRALLDQAVQSGRPRFRLAIDLGATPTLMVAARSSFDPATQEILVLQTPFDRDFLNGLAAGFKVTPHLLSIDGTLLVAGAEDAAVPPLGQTEMSMILAGKSVFKTVDLRRYLYQAVPLGTTDLVIAVAEAPMNELGGALESLTLRSIAVLLAALAIGSLLYYRLMRQITGPLAGLLQGMRAVGSGNLSFRLRQPGDDEIGTVGAALNAMLDHIETVHAENLGRQKDATMAEAEVRHRQLLERKNLEISLAGQELKAAQGEVSLLLQMIQATNAIQDINVYMERVLELVQRTIRCRSLLLLVHNPGNEDLEVRKTAGCEPDLLLRMRFRVDSGFTGRAAKLQEMIYLSDLQSDNARFDYRSGTLPGGSLVCAPLVMNRRLAGLVLLLKDESHGFRETELRLIQAISWQSAIGLETARLYDWTHNLATTDDLTGLSNRRFFQDILKRELTQAQRYGSPFSLLMLDLDHFHEYNERNGNLCGDSALKQVANVLLQNTRGIDLVARFGTDQFIILLPKTDKHGAFKAAEKLRRCIVATDFPGAAESQPEGRLTVSIGISGYPADSRELYEIIDRADRALYQAKQAGRNCCHFWQVPPDTTEIPKEIQSIR